MARDDRQVEPALLGAGLALFCNSFAALDAAMALTWTRRPVSGAVLGAAAGKLRQWPPPGP